MSAEPEKLPAIFKDACGVPGEFWIVIETLAWSIGIKAPAG